MARGPRRGKLVLLVVLAILLVRGRRRGLGLAEFAGVSPGDGAGWRVVSGWGQVGGAVWCGGWRR